MNIRKTFLNLFFISYFFQTCQLPHHTTNAQTELFEDPDGQPVLPSSLTPTCWLRPQQLHVPNLNNTNKVNSTNSLQ